MGDWHAWLALRVLGHCNIPIGSFTVKPVVQHHKANTSHPSGRSGFYIQYLQHVEQHATISSIQVMMHSRGMRQYLDG